MGLDVKVIQSSFAALAPQAAAIAERFYEILWQDNPGADQLFANADMSKQKTALVNSLVFVVDHLEDPSNLEKYLHALGARHVAYGAEDIHYDLVGAALLKTFAEFAGDLWTPKLAQEWTQAYGIIASIMQEGASVQRSLLASDMHHEPTSAQVIALRPGETPKLPDALIADIHREVEDLFEQAVAAEVSRAWQHQVEQFNASAIGAQLREQSVASSPSAKTAKSNRSKRKKAS